MTQELIGTDRALGDIQQRSLGLLLDMIVPASDDGAKPSAAEVDVLGYIREYEPDTLAPLGVELDRLESDAVSQAGAPFADLDAEARHRLVETLRTEDPSFLRRLAQQTVTAYYQDDRVLRAIGMEPRAPFPKGYEVPAGDQSLLDPVRARGRIYREA